MCILPTTKIISRQILQIQSESDAATESVNTTE